MNKRKNLRLKEYDYSTTGIYFITICTDNRQKILCDIKEDILESECDNIFFEKYIKYTKNGIIIKDEIDKISFIYEDIKVKRYVIMPNHIHLLIEVNNSKNKKTISKIIQLFKSSVTKKIGYNIWQRSFYEHIIRNEKELKLTEKYIVNNPLKWKTDEYY